MSHAEFVHLHRRNEHSLLDGVCDWVKPIEPEPNALDGRPAKDVMRRLVTSFFAFLLTAWPTGVRAADVSHYRVLKTQCNIQTSDNAPTPSARSFGFWAQVWQSTDFSVSTATVTAPNFSITYLTGGGYPLVLSSLSPFASQASLDSVQPAGNYRFTFNTIHNGTTNLTLSLPAGAYPPAPHINNQAALQSVDPSSGCIVSWDAFIGGTPNDLIELQILNSAGVVYASGRIPGAPGALNGEATGTSIPANTLIAGRSYVGRLAFIRVASTNYAYAPGFAAYAQQTDFYISTTGATPPVLLSAVPSLGASNVPGNVKVVFNFNKPMRGPHSLLVLGVTNSTSKSWSSNQLTVTFSSAYLWPSNVIESWYLNSFGRPLGFGDTNDSPVMTETLATRFTAGTNVLPAIPLSPRLQIVVPATDGTVQLQLTGGEAYRSYQIQASGDLRSWFTLDTVSATNSSFTLSDVAPPPTNRNYRAVALP